MIDYLEDLVTYKLYHSRTLIRKEQEISDRILRKLYTELILTYINRDEAESSTTLSEGGPSPPAPLSGVVQLNSR